MATPGRGIVSVDCAGEVVQAIWTKPNEPEERQVLEAGDNGMATCTCCDGSTYYSNVPNLVLKSREDSKVKVRRMKRPGAASPIGKQSKKKAKKKAADDTASKDEGSYSADGESGVDSFFAELDAQDQREPAEKIAKKPAAADPPPKKKQDTST